MPPKRTTAQQELAKAFGRRLTELREAKGLNKQELAESAGLPRPHVSKLEGGTLLPNWPTVCALAEALGVSVEAFRSSEDQRDHAAATLAKVREWFEQSPLRRE
jgi:transcriptional regulator with XRE-family HTH domain